MNFSVIIPHSNIPEYLTRCISSIPEREDIEVIVVDNSTIPVDLEVCALHRTNVHFLFSSPKRGAGGARNEGIVHSRGKWLLFCDADDYFMPNAFSVFDSHCDDSEDIIFFNATSCNLVNDVPSRRHHCVSNYIKEYNRTRNEHNLRFYSNIPWAKMINSQLVLNNHFFFDEVVVRNDVMFSLKTGFAASMIAVDDSVVYCVTEREDSLTTKLSLDTVYCDFKVRSRANKYLSNHGLKRFYPISSDLVFIRQHDFVLYLSCLIVSIIRRDYFVDFRKRLTRWMERWFQKVKNYLRNK